MKRILIIHCVLCTNRLFSAPSTNLVIKATARREAARAVGQGYVSEKAFFGVTHVQSGTDLVGVALHTHPFAASPS